MEKLEFIQKPIDESKQGLDRLEKMECFFDGSLFISEFLPYDTRPKSVQIKKHKERLWKDVAQYCEKNKVQIPEKNF